jgi:methylated-DNA-[protein]-cysteine S-methyltransferase
MTAVQPDHFRLDRLKTPIGEALLVTDADGCLRMLDWSDFESRLQRLLQRQYGTAVEITPGRAPAAMRRVLDDYFAGDLAGLRTITWRTGGTPFQRKVWKALCGIPAGKTLSYGALAARLGMPRAMRAVGLANGANPISVVVPCHRVIGSDGTLTGYGGGLPRKRWLLTHEGAEFRDQGLPRGKATDAGWQRAGGASLVRNNGRENLGGRASGRRRSVSSPRVGPTGGKLQ